MSPFKFAIAAILSFGVFGCVSNDIPTGAALESIAAGGSSLFKSRTSIVNAPVGTVNSRLKMFTDNCHNVDVDITGKTGKQTVAYRSAIETVPGGQSLVLYVNMASGFAHASEATKGFKAYSSSKYVPQGSGTQLTTTRAFATYDFHDLIVAHAEGRATGCPDMTNLVGNL